MKRWQNGKLKLLKAVEKYSYKVKHITMVKSAVNLWSTSQTCANNSYYIVKLTYIMVKSEFDYAYLQQVWG